MSRNDQRAAGHQAPDDGSPAEWTMPDLLALRLPDDAAARSALRAELTSQWTGEIPVLRDRPRGRHAAPDDLPDIGDLPDESGTSTAALVSGTGQADGAAESVAGSAGSTDVDDARPRSIPAAQLLAGVAPTGRRRARRLAQESAPTALPTPADAVTERLPVIAADVPDPVLNEVPDVPAAAVPVVLVAADDAATAPDAEADTAPDVETDSFDEAAADAEAEPASVPAPAGPVSGGSSRPRLGRYGRPALVAGTAAVCLLTAAGGTVAAMDKDVTILVDGTPTQVSTLAGDVAGALQSAGISVGEYDALAPAPSAQIKDGSKISLNRAREITVVIDGDEKTIWTTARTVDEALAELGDGDARLKLSADRSRPIPLQGMEITGDTEHSVALTVAGVRTKELTTAATVADLLAEQKVTVDADDVLRPAATTEVTDGLKVEVVKREVVRKATRKAIPQPADRTIEDPQVRRHTTKVTQGRAGVEEFVHQTVTTNGKTGAPKLVSKRVLRTAEATTTHIGTKIVEPQDAWNVPWDDMAFCESTGRWDINTGNGTYGGLQFMTSTWLANGGGEFADRADLATKDEQIAVAERLYAKEGLAPWHCARLLGWGFGEYTGGW